MEEVTYGYLKRQIHAQTPHPEHLFLLDCALRVIGLRPAAEADGTLPRVGEFFFRYFAMNEETQSTLRRLMDISEESTYLFLAGERPAAAICRFFGRSRFLLVAMPTGELRRHLDAPAAYAELFPHYCALLSAELLARHAPPTTEGYLAIFRWLQRLHLPFQVPYIGPNQTEQALFGHLKCLTHLAVFCGCHASIDFSPLLHRTHSDKDFALLIPAALALFLLAVRLDASGGVEILTDDTSPDGPMLLALLETDGRKHRYWEIEGLCHEAMWRGEVFDILPHPTAPQWLHLRIGLSAKELSTQGIKAKDEPSRRVPIQYPLPKEVYANFQEKD